MIPENPKAIEALSRVSQLLGVGKEFGDGLCTVLIEDKNLQADFLDRSVE